MAHARAMAGERTEAMPTVPVPVDDPRGQIVWEETLAAGGYAVRRLARGTRLRLIDLYGDACVSMLVFNAEAPFERLNVADTVKIQWNAYLGSGRLLLSDMGRVLMSMVEDGSAGHDIFCGASNAASNSRRYGDGANHGPHPNARDRFALGVAKLGLDRKDIHPCINWFKPVRIDADGTTRLDVGPFESGQELVLRAEMELFVVLANCPHVLDPRAPYSVTPVRATAWRGDVTPMEDPVRTATPEGLRAFLNVEDYFQR